MKKHGEWPGMPGTWCWLKLAELPEGDTALGTAKEHLVDCEACLKAMALRIKLTNKRGALKRGFKVGDP